MNSSTSNPGISMYPLKDDYLGKIHIKDKNKASGRPSKLTTIVVLDRSSSMIGTVERFVNKILTLIFKKLDYSMDEVIHLITFDSVSEKYEIPIKTLEILPMEGRACTYMAEAVKLLSQVSNQLPNDTGIRLLTVSDGEIYDPDETREIADQLAISFGEKFEVNSQAVRLFTSETQPDTRAICSLLQLNNVMKVELLDLNTSLSDEEISTAVANLFKNDNLTHRLHLQSQENILKTAPWSNKYINKIRLIPGENIFWEKKISEKNPSPLTLEGDVIDTVVQPTPDIKTYNELVKDKMDQYQTQMRILKVIDSEESNATVTNMVNYFKQEEEYILSKEENTSDNDTTDQPDLYAEELIEIAEDKTVSQADSAQQADYLRQGRPTEKKTNTTIGTSSNNLQLLLYPLQDEFIGKIHINDNGNIFGKASKLTTFVLLDCSRSMARILNRFVNKILPLVFLQLQYSFEEVIHLITFNTISENRRIPIKSLETLQIEGCGCTRMSGAVKLLSQITKQLSKDTGIRLLTVSDGEVQDPVHTQKEADYLASRIDQRFVINSQAIRIFTSHLQPDTRALAGLLQLNNVKTVDLLHLTTLVSDEEISTAITNLFKDDNLNHQLHLRLQKNICKRTPWFTEYTNQITLLPGENVFWMKKIPDGLLTLEGSIINVVVQPTLNLQTYKDLVKDKIDQYVTQIRILKVIDSEESNENITNLVNYFKKLEQYILSRKEKEKNGTTETLDLYAEELTEIANDNSVCLSDPAQQANYLRQGRLKKRNITKSSSSTNLDLLLYPLQNEFLGKIHISDNILGMSKLTTIVLLDCSGSMGKTVNRFINKILPLVFQKLDYSVEEVIHLIKFNSNPEKYEIPIKSLETLQISGRGYSNMVSSIQLISEIINHLPKHTGIRLLTITDGEIHDPDETRKIVDQLAVNVRKNFNSNSQIVRLLSSFSQPDTRAICSLLQLNNVKKIDLLDLSTSLSDIEIATAIANLFIDDQLTQQSYLTSEEDIFKRDPWLNEYTNKIILFPGDNIFWVKKIPDDPLTLEDSLSIYTVVPVPEPILQTYFHSLEDKMGHIMMYIRILKVIGTQKSILTIAYAVDYLKKQKQDIHFNVLYAKELDNIATDDIVCQLKSAQLVDYLKLGRHVAFSTQTTENSDFQPAGQLKMESSISGSSSQTIKSPDLHPVEQPKIPFGADLGSSSQTIESPNLHPIEQPKTALKFVFGSSPQTIKNADFHAVEQPKIPFGASLGSSSQTVKMVRKIIRKPRKSLDLHAVEQPKIPFGADLGSSSQTIKSPDLHPVEQPKIPFGANFGSSSQTIKSPDVHPVEQPKIPLGADLGSSSQTVNSPDLHPVEEPKISFGRPCSTPVPIIPFSLATEKKVERPKLW